MHEENLGPYVYVYLYVCAYLYALKYKCMTTVTGENQRLLAY